MQSTLLYSKRMGLSQYSSSSFMEENSPSISTISIRLAFFVFLLSTTLYANYESSKNFDITVSVLAESPPSRTFHLLFVSNGRASRILLESSALMQNIPCMERPIRHVHVQLASHNLPEPVAIAKGSRAGEFVIMLSMGVLLERDGVKLVELALRRAMERVWIRAVQGLSDPSLTGRDPIGMLEETWKDGVENVSTSSVGPRQVI